MLRAQPQLGQPKLLGPEGAGDGKGGHPPRAYPGAGNATQPSLCLPGSHSLSCHRDLSASLERLPDDQLGGKMFSPKTAPAGGQLSPLSPVPWTTVPQGSLLFSWPEDDGFALFMGFWMGQCGSSQPPPRPQAGTSAACVGRRSGQDSATTPGEMSAGNVATEGLCSEVMASRSRAHGHRTASVAVGLLCNPTSLGGEPGTGARRQQRWEDPLGKQHQPPASDQFLGTPQVPHFLYADPEPAHGAPQPAARFASPTRASPRGTA